jgi:hypothetical protein
MDPLAGCVSNCIGDSCGRRSLRGFSGTQERCTGPVDEMHLEVQWYFGKAHDRIAPDEHRVVTQILAIDIYRLDQDAERLSS